MFIKMNGRQLSSNNLTKIKKSNSKDKIFGKIDLNSPKVNKSYVGINQEKKKLSRENSLENSTESLSNNYT